MSGERKTKPPSQKPRLEHLEQRDFVSWFRRTHPEILIFAIPNGGARSKATAGKLKAEGVLAGVPDLYIPLWNTWIEMKKTSGGRLTPEQKKVITQLRQINEYVIVARGCNHAIKCLDGHDVSMW